MNKPLAFLLSLLLLLSMTTYAQKIHLKKEGNGYWILENQDKIFFFQREMNDSVPAFARNNYFHPVYDLNGNCITEDYPADHLHHRGIFWAWHQVLVNGEPICDPWDTKNFWQNINEFEFLVNENGNGIIKYTSYWHAADRPNDPFLMEKTVITVYQRTNRYRQIDFSISFRALENNLTIGGSDDEKGYGGFTVRLKTNELSQFTNAEKEKIEPINLAMAAGQFVDISNPELKRGVTIVSGSNNPGEDRWILRQTGSAQNCAWPGRIPVPFFVEEPTNLNYTILIHKGKLKKIPIQRIIKNNTQ